MCWLKSWSSPEAFMSQIPRRLNRLENLLGPCRLCRDDPVRVLRYRQPSPGAEPALLAGQEEPRPCPVCQREPEVLEVVEVVVRTRDEARAALALAERELR
jgi:hypothetical protein